MRLSTDEFWWRCFGVGFVVAMVGIAAAMVIAAIQSPGVPK